MLSKRKLKGGTVRVTFAMPALEGRQTLHLAGDFNDWSVTATPMERQSDDSWAVKLDLEGNLHYHYSYLADGHEWHNDWAADEYAPNAFGGDNSVVVLSDTEKPPRAARRTARPAAKSTRKKKGE